MKIVIEEVDECGYILNLEDEKYCVTTVHESIIGLFQAIIFRLCKDYDFKRIIIESKDFDELSVISGTGLSTEEIEIKTFIKKWGNELAKKSTLQSAKKSRAKSLTKIHT